MNWCYYHPDLPQYFGPLIENRMAGPAGRFPCCGQQAFRFSTLTIPMVIMVISFYEQKLYFST